MGKKTNKLLLLAAKIAVSVSVLYLILKETGAGKVFDVLRSINPLFFFGSLLLYVFSLYISSLRWRLLLSRSGRAADLPLSRFFTLYFMGAFFNNILPGVIGGDAVRIYYLYRDTGDAQSSIGSVFADRYVGFVALLTLGLLALPFGFQRIRGTGIEWMIPVIVLLFIVASVLMFGLRVGKRFSKVRGFYDYFTNLWRSPAILVKTVTLSIIIQVIGIFSVYLISIGLGSDTGLTELFIFLPIIITVTTIPVSISGLGLREGAFVFLLGFVGVRPEVATSISLAWFFSYALGSVPGVFFYMRWRVKGGITGTGFTA